MSYRNPTMIPPADPMAFSRGFEQAFSKQQSAFQADLEERKRLAQEADEALANAYAMADIGPINGIDNKFNQALQDSLNKIIDDGDFANASKADQVKMLQDLRLKKAAFGRIGEIMSVDTEDWDLRNDPKLSAFRKAVLSGEDFKIDSSGLDFKINGSFGTITLDDIANTRIINKAPYEEKLDQINGDFKERYGKLVLTAYKEGKSEQEIQALKQTLKSSYGSLLKSQDPDFKKYMQYNVAETDDENQMIENMFNQIDADVLDPSLVYKRPVEETKEQKLSTGLTKEQSQTALSNVVNLGKTTLDESGAPTKTSPFYQVRIKGPDDIVPTNYKFRLVGDQYYVMKPGMGTAQPISEEDIYNLFGYSEEYQKMAETKKQNRLENIGRAKDMVAERYGIQRPVRFDGSN